MKDSENTTPHATGEDTEAEVGDGGQPSDVEVPAQVQSVDEGLPNDELPDDETIVRDTQSE
ncbi:hypothetical protein [Agromyces sp. Leaf222]|uniref:hypothetical protein n=1 Tax=Agromyces sp. Leaf222 TaxID=1735688 RepID=UPI0006F4623E|nr:hypothetical protein [Agromyces sp. Leaf222]KQM81322.1 hypothetical protein ASE68_16175 [Agromyces sp. Leaf222]